MKFNLSLKDTQITIIEDLKNKYPTNSNEEIVKKYVSAALQLNKNDMIFDIEREKCSGGCFASEPKFEVDMDEGDFRKLKDIYENYDFDDYKTYEEKVSKIIRCIFNFIEDEPDVISL